MTTTDPRVSIALAMATGLMLGCAANIGAPPQTPAAPTAVLATPTVGPPTATPAPGFTPEVTQRNSAGVPLPAAPGARSVVVTYTPVPNTIQVKSGVVTVSIGDNYFEPDEVHVTVGTTVEWRYDGAGGETESTHNVISLDKAFDSGDLNPGTRYAFTFKGPGDFAYVCSYHAALMKGKIVVQ
jgi:plastocyanin